MLAALASQLFVLCKSFQKACRKLPRSDIMNKLKLSAACRRTLGCPVKTESVSAKLRQRYLLGDNLPHLPCTFEELSPSFMVKCHQGLKTSAVMAGTHAAVRASQNDSLIRYKLSGRCCINGIHTATGVAICSGIWWRCMHTLTHLRPAIVNSQVTQVQL